MIYPGKILNKADINGSTKKNHHSSILLGPAVACAWSSSVALGAAVKLFFNSIC